jgi:hypothetical protein
MRGIFSWTKVLALVVAGSAAGTTALAQWHTPDRLKGVVNDHPVSPSTGGSTIWELRGPWSLDMLGDSGTANFSAALTMEYSDIYMGSVAAAATDARHQHTHTINMSDATVIESPSDCPTGTTPYPTYTWQFEVTGMAVVTGNGGSPFAGPVPLQVCVGGGPDLRYSNITLVFTDLPDNTPSAATSHFGGQPIHGVVTKVQSRAAGEHDR